MPTLMLSAVSSVSLSETILSQQISSKSIYRSSRLALETAKELGTLRVECLFATSIRRSLRWKA